MSILKRSIVALVGSAIGVPVLAIVLTIILRPALEPRPRAVSPDSIPVGFPMVAVWRDSSGHHCRAFLHAELRRSGSRLGDFDLAPFSEAEAEACDRAFEAYLSTGEWPDTVIGAGARSPAIAHLEVSYPEPGAADVRVKYGADDDAPNDAWYRARQGSRRPENPRYLRYFGPAHGLGILFVVAPLSLGLYLVAATIWVLRGRKGWDRAPAG